MRNNNYAEQIGPSTINKIIGGFFMKIKLLLLSFTVGVTLFAGCAPKATPTPSPAATITPKITISPSLSPSPSATPSTNAVTTASIVNNEAAFLKAISKDGTWIIAILNDMTINKELVLDGQFKNKDVIDRKLALYAQDANKTITARYTLKAPKFTIKSENARIEHGTFVGDVYVDAKGFKLTDAKIDGNLYFTTEEYKSTYKADATSSVTGTTAVKK